LIIAFAVLSIAGVSSAQSFELTAGDADPLWSLGARYHPPDWWWAAGKSPDQSRFWERHLSFYFDFLMSKNSSSPRGTDYSDILGPGGFPGDDLTGQYDVFLLGFVGGVELWSDKPISFSAVTGFRPSFGCFAGVSHIEGEFWNEYYDPMHILDASGYYKCKSGSHKEVGFEYGIGLAVSPLVLRYSKDTSLGERYQLGLVIWGSAATD
jgi:hypothetical protein